MHTTISRNNGDLFMEKVALSDIANQFGTPCYVYSRTALKLNFEAYTSALGNHPHLICYAVKSNSNIAVLQTLSALGAGFDIVSIGELERVLIAGGDPSKIVFFFSQMPAFEVLSHCCFTILNLKKWAYSSFVLQSF